MRYEMKKEVTYKGHVIRKIEDRFGQTFATIDESSKLYYSIADAKRVVNRKQPLYEIL